MTMKWDWCCRDWDFDFLFLLKQGLRVAVRLFSIGSTYRAALLRPGIFSGLSVTFASVDDHIRGGWGWGKRGRCSFLVLLVLKLNFRALMQWKF